ncbi:MAG: membrane protein insertase YidC [Chloroflexi bacterium]|nr:membrane protein insertase YidC [Chloroflexota bacterium]
MAFLGILWNEIIMRPMVNSLALLYDLLGDNFGLSIIVFTIGIRFLLIPMTMRQTKQMKAMSGLQPRIKGLQEKYKGKSREERAGLSRETMALYKENGVNPIGCLGPMVIQMPIWFGLFRALFKVVPPTPEGLANLDGLFYSWNPARHGVPFNSDFLGLDLVGLVSAQPVPINILLPVLVGGSMWLTQKMTMTKPSDDRQAQTNQIMLWMMPIMFGFFTFQFPTGLAFYIFVSNVAGFVIQYFVTGRQNPFKSSGVESEPTLAAVGSGTTGSGDNDMEGSTSDADSTVHSEDRRRSNRSRARDTRAKSRRSRNRRR